MFVRRGLFLMDQLRVALEKVRTLVLEFGERFVGWWRTSGNRKKAYLIGGVPAALFLVFFLYLWFSAGYAAEQLTRPSFVYDTRAKVWFKLQDPRGTHVPLDVIPRHVQQAILAAEDRRFYEHGALDLQGIARAAWVNTKAVQIVEGGSTLTQQLARQIFLTHRRTLMRKLQEMVLAIRLENLFYKEKILEMYLNRVYLGYGSYGMEAAAQDLFGKSIRQVNLGEAAALAAIVRSPNNYNPRAGLAAAQRRRDQVLERMVGVGFLTPEQARAAAAVPLKLSRRSTAGAHTENYVKDYVQAELVRILGEGILNDAGLRIYTTYSAEVQAMAQQAAVSELARIEQSKRLFRHKNKSDPLQVAVVVLEPETGAIVAMVGGRDYGDSQFNRPIQALRQPGSAFKPFIYAQALRHGLTPASRIRIATEMQYVEDPDTLALVEEPVTRAILMRDGLRRSENRAATELQRIGGTRESIALARQLGITTDLPAVESLALGSGEVRLLELTAAYAAFPNGGNAVSPFVIREVQNARGRTLYKMQSRQRAVLDGAHAFQMVSMLRDVVLRGTAASAARLGVTFAAAGKTGTTNDYKDAWFVGFSTTLVCGVWVGYDDPRPIMAGGYGAQLALPIWAQTMRGAARLYPPGSFRMPPGLHAVELCRVSGGLPTAGCNEVLGEDGLFVSNIYSEVLIPGTEPDFYCDVHVVVERPDLFSRIGGVLGKIFKDP